MTQPARTSTSKDTDAHLQAWHGIQPPYLDTPETVHTWLHNDQAEARDADHALSNLKAGRS